MTAFDNVLRLREELEVTRDDLLVLDDGVVFYDGGDAEMTVGTLRRNGRRWTVDRSAFGAARVDADTRREVLDRLARAVTDERVNAAPDPSGLTVAQARRVRREVDRERSAVRMAMGRLEEAAYWVRNAYEDASRAAADPSQNVNSLGILQGQGPSLDVRAAVLEAAKDSLARAILLARDLGVEVEPDPLDAAAEGFGRLG